MNRKWLASALAVAMMMTLLPVHSFADDSSTAEVPSADSIVEIVDTDETDVTAEPETTAEQEVVEVKDAVELKDKVEKAENNVETTIRLTNDIVVSESMTIGKSQIIILDMNGKQITVTPDFSNRIFTNNGTLTIKGNGTIDVTAAGANGNGTVNNYGTLTVVGGTYTNPKESNASNFYNRSGGTATFENVTINGGGGCIATQVDTTTTINGGYYENSTYPAIENRGNMLITGGTFINTSCSSCDGSRYGYTVRSGESSANAYLKIQGENEDSVKVTGVQGGLAVIGGTADIYNGVYETVACKIHGGDKAFYAGYFTGESYKTATTIYGGSFTSYAKTAVLVGNGNPAPDSGAGLESTVMIKGAPL